MNAHTIRLDFRYRESLLAFGAGITATTIFAAVTCSQLVSGAPVEFFFNLHGWAARGFWLLATTFLAVGTLMLGRRMWSRFSAPNRKLAFTPSGLLLPDFTTRNAVVVVDFNDVTGLSVAEIRNPMSRVLKKVTGVTLTDTRERHVIHASWVRDAIFETVLIEIFESISGPAADEIDPALCFDIATQQETAGEWHLAFRYFSLAADRLAGTQDGDYAINCVKRLKEKIDLGA